MMHPSLRRAALVFGAVFGVASAPAVLDAQKALVYCPVTVDATGCNAIVAALTGPAYPLGVDRGYDGTGGTVDLKTVDLFSYSVFVVPSLADGATSQPYAKLREVEVVEHLKAALIGRIAMWSGSPDQGATNRAMKDALIQNLASWAGGAFGTAKGPGLVALLDASATPGARYDWVRSITPVPVTADANLLIYSDARGLNARGTTILTSGAGPIKYDNMATFGFQVPNGAAGVSLDAVGQTGTAVGGQVVLLTVEAGNSTGAIVRTDKDDYSPGTTVVITGSGWEPNETVKLTLHMDPLRDVDTELTAVADPQGNIRNTDFAPKDYDIGVRFVLTAIGQVSGRRAQATFTDDTKIKDMSISPGTRSIAAGSPTGYTVTLNFNGSGTCTAALTITTPLPSGVSASISPVNLTGTATESKTATLSITTAAATPVGSTTFTVRAQGTGSGSGANDCGSGDAATATAILTIGAAANAAPELGAVGNKSVNELATLLFTATATDANAGQTLTFSLDAGAPPGASINASTGAFSWTPTEAQGPGSFPVTVRVSDNGSPAASDFEAITITVAEANVAPVLAPIGNKSVDEGAALTFTATATDADLPINTLTFSLAAGTTPVPSGATINSSTGAFSWTPTEAQGPGEFKFKVVVTDNASPNASDDEEITVTVAEVNAAPIIAAIPDKTGDELTLLSFTATATDSDAPANTLTFSLQGTVPPGAAISLGGAFTWTPTEAQGAGMYNITVRATDNGTPAKFAETVVKIEVKEVNVAPTLTDVPPTKTIPELALYSFDANATDPDAPPQGLTFSLDGAPAGASIDPSTGVFSWTPTEAQGPGPYTFKVKVSDGVVTAEASTTLTVDEVNQAPVLAAIGNKSADELAALTFTASATDGDLPANTLTYSLVGAPAGATIDATTGAFSWTPTETQGPGTYPLTVKVVDNGTPSLSDEEQITVTVNEVNALPTLTGVPTSETIPELAPYTFDANATDSDLPTQTLTFALVGAPTGAAISPTTGVFTWTPSEAQGPGTYTFQVKVGDGIGETTQFVSLTVTEVNVAPVLGAIGNKTVNELIALAFTAAATDADEPPNTLTFSLVDAPTGASINATSGAFTWTPTEAQGPGNYTFTVKVNDSATPSLSDEETITVTVNEVNLAPVLDPIANRSVDEETSLAFTATASDPDLPVNGLAFSLIAGADPVPGGATINPSTGAFTWTPTEAQGFGVYKFKVRVTDNGTPALFADQEITITVNEVNKAPVLGAIGSKTVNEEVALALTATASDPDLPPNTLTFSLLGAPAGATISTGGVFGWTPTEAQGPGTFTFTVRVTDNGSPALSDEEEITVTVNEVNKAPVVDAIPDKVVDEETPLSFTATATDPDIPANPFTFSLVGAPAGASITAAGAFSWTPTEAQGPGVYNITVRATDNGTPVLFGETIVKVSVNEVNKAPTVAAIPDKTVDELTALTFTASAFDPDLPANTLTYSLIGAPAGATVNASNGDFSWTPTETQGPGVYTFTVRATDDGTPSLSDDKPVKVTVKEVNVAPMLAPVGNKTVDEGSLLAFTASATDDDVPANALSYSLVSGPAGASINQTSGAFTWTPTEAQGPGSYTFTVKVTDDGTPVLSDEESITVTVNEVNEAPVLAAIGDKSVNELTPLAFTATATDIDVPANTLSYSLVGAPAGAAINASTGAFSWTPTEAQGPGSYTFTVKVTDNGTPALSDEEQIKVTVAEVNVAPVLAAIGNKTIDEGTALTFTASAADADLPANGLTFSLTGTIPAGASINASTGAFTWTPPDGPVTQSITVRVTDDGSPAMYDEETITVTVTNVKPTALFVAPEGPFNEGATFAISMSGARDVPADQPTLQFSFDCGDGLGYRAPTTTPNVTCPAVDNASQTVRGKVIDKDGAYSAYEGAVLVSNVKPTLNTITFAPGDVIPLTTTLSATATFTDPGVKDTHTGTFAWGDGTTSAATFTGTNTSGTAAGTHKYASPGVYVITLTVSDKDGGEASQTHQYVVVYDPSAGFVTGGGWINTTAGSYVPNPTLTGKATFGFVSKYKKGQSTPEGNTEFQFHAAGMNFKSSLYEWLVVAGAKAQFKGTGTIDGAGNYGFLLTAIDGQLNGGGGTDKFRIKIWDKNNGDAVVYDNQMGTIDTGDPSTVISGGSINIQAK